MGLYADNACLVQEDIHYWSDSDTLGDATSRPHGSIDGNGEQVARKQVAWKLARYGNPKTIHVKGTRRRVALRGGWCRPIHRFKLLRQDLESATSTDCDLQNCASRACLTIRHGSRSCLHKRCMWVCIGSRRGS